MTQELAGVPRHPQANEVLGVKGPLQQANPDPDEEASGVWAGGILLSKSVNSRNKHRESTHLAARSRKGGIRERIR